MIAAGLLTPEQAYHAIDWNTIVLLLGMLVLSGSLRLAGFFEWAAEVVLTHVRTPIALIKRSDLPVLPYLFALAIGANIGSVMTVVGNPQNTIIAHAAPLSDVGFARVLAPIGLAPRYLSGCAHALAPEWLAWDDGAEAEVLISTESRCCGTGAGLPWGDGRRHLGWGVGGHHGLGGFRAAPPQA